MKSTIEKLEGNKVMLEVEVEVARVDEALDRAYKKVVKQVSLPGFRKGKVPRGVLEARFGVEVLYEEAVDILLSEAYGEALKDNDLDPIAQPKIEDLHIEKGEPFTFKAEVEVMPEVELGEYKNLSVTRKVKRIADEDVDGVLKQGQERMAEMVTSDKEKVEQGDFAVIDFEGFVDDEPFAGGAANNHVLEIGSGSFIPGFEDGVVGMTVGETKDIPVKFPENYAEELAGKDAIFKVKLNEIKVKELPELDDEFAKDVSEFDTMAEFRADIRQRLESSAQEQSTSTAKDDLIGQAVDAATVDLPETLVKRSSQFIMNDFSRDLAYQGFTLDKYLEAVGKTKAEFEDELKPQAERRTKTDLVLDAIARAEGIEVSEEEIDKEIEEMTSGLGNNADKRKQELNTPERRETIAERVRINKTIDLIYDAAQIIDEIVDNTDEQEATEGQEE